MYFKNVGKRSAVVDVAADLLIMDDGEGANSHADRSKEHINRPADGKLEVLFR